MDSSSNVSPPSWKTQQNLASWGSMESVQNEHGKMHCCSLVRKITKSYMYFLLSFFSNNFNKIILHRSTSKPWYMSFYWNFLLLLGNKKSGGSCARCSNFKCWTFKNRIIWKHEIFEITPNQWSSSQRMLQTSSQRDYMALLAWMLFEIFST